MNEGLEQKIMDLMVEAGKQGEWPVRAVLHLLLGSYRMAQQKKFARHCCQFSEVKFRMETEISDQPDDISNPHEHNQYYH
jgi:hypothetical protein